MGPEAATVFPAALQYGALGLLGLVLVGAFFLLRWAIGKLDASLASHTAAMVVVADKLAEGETRAIERHARTHETVRSIVREELAPILNKLNEVLGVDREVRDRVTSTASDLSRIVTDSAKETRHSLRGALHEQNMYLAEFIEALIEPLHRVQLGSRPNMPAPRPPRPSTPDKE